MVSCKKENPDIEDLLSKYQPICNIWKPQTISYDSMGIRVTQSIQYDRMIINDNLSYEIYPDVDNRQIEHGTITIISQTNDKLEIHFTAEYPITSSFAGSHIFGFSDIILDSISNDKMILKADEYQLLTLTPTNHENTFIWNMVAVFSSYILNWNYVCLMPERRYHIP